jgi:hypothetical protein
MKNFTLNVNVKSGFEELRSERIELANWEQVENALKSLCAPNRGSVTVTLSPSPPLGPENLQVFAEADVFYLMLGENVEEDGELDFAVRTFYNSSGRVDKEIEIGGGVWPEHQVCFDLKTVLAFFSEFCQTGDVLDDRLS